MIRLALLGDPVEHSRSPAMQEAALRAAGLPGSYVARRVDSEGMKHAAQEIRDGRLDGANITMPHKRLARLLSDEVEADAARAGSVNTWRRVGAGLVGASTDITGIRRLWARRELPVGEVLILGSGGAAAAALVALEGAGIRIAARRAEQVRALLEATEVVGEIARWGAAAAGAVVVNATPLGMRGERLPGSTIAGAGGLVDMAYGPTETPAVSAARARGIPVADGIDLLVAQAEDAFFLWTGQYPPEGLMEATARKASSGP